MSYWKANPHEWGEGQIHLIHPDGSKTRCGKRLAECPGRYVPEREYTCRACAKVIDAEEQRRWNQERWQYIAAERQRQQEADNAEWWRKYNAYLESPQWKRRRAAVMKRARGICEGCGEARADEVHHTTYAHLFNEPLFELVALCNTCHARITSLDRARRAG